MIEILRDVQQDGRNGRIKLPPDFAKAGDKLLLTKMTENTWKLQKVKIVPLDDEVDNK